MDEERDERLIELPVWAARALDCVFDQHVDEERMEESYRRGSASRVEIAATLLVRAKIAALEATR